MDAFQEFIMWNFVNGTRSRVMLKNLIKQTQTHTKDDVTIYGIIVNSNNNKQNIEKFVR